MPTAVPIQRLVDLLDPNADVLLNVSPIEAAEAVASGDPARVRNIDGQFAIVQRRGHVVRLARSIGRPMKREYVPRVGAERLGSDAHLIRDLLHEVMRQDHAVVSPLPEWRDVDA